MEGLVNGWMGVAEGGREAGKEQVTPDPEAPPMTSLEVMEDALPVKETGTGLEKGVLGGRSQGPFLSGPPTRRTGSYLEAAISAFWRAMAAARWAPSMLCSTFWRTLLLLSGSTRRLVPLTSTLCRYLPSSRWPSGSVVQP